MMELKGGVGDNDSIVLIVRLYSGPPDLIQLVGAGLQTPPGECITMPIRTKNPLAGEHRLL